VRWPLTRYGTRELVLLGLPLAAATAVAVWWVPPAAAVPAVVLVFVVAFFRDPERTPPAGGEKVLSPADGRVADVEEMHEEEFLGADALRVGIFMSVFNVHVNRAPVSGRVVYRGYRRGKFRNAMSAAASRENECAVVGLERADGRRVLVKQIAGLIARRIVCDCAEGDRLERGRRFGMVKFGSRLEVTVPRAAGFRPMVAVGDRVRAGETVLGVLEERATE
jgi:phosphatidylserine decarboxylase